MKLFTQSGTKIPDFLTKKKTTILFLACVSLFAGIFIAIYKPINSTPQWHPVLYTGLLVGSGFVTLLVSRLLIYAVNRHRRLLMWQYIVWLVAEIVVFAVGLAFFSMLLHPTESFFVLLGRVTIDVVSILLIPYTLTVLLFLLEEKKREISRLTTLIDKQTAPAVVPGNTINFYDKGGKLAFATRRSNILYIEAADNYCNIHYMNEEKEDTFIVHNSMKCFDEADSHTGLLRCHRRYIVNIENVRLLRKESDRLMFELTQGTKAIPVSRSYKERVVRCFTAIDTEPSATHKGDSEDDA